MKITVGIIVLNSDFFLKQAIESIYEVAHAICIAQGPVTWWKDQGVLCSAPETMEILHTFPDPDKKIKIFHATYKEKTEQCQAWFKMVPEDTDYILCIDADEIHTSENIEKLIMYLEKHKPDRVGFKSDTFFGGFDRIVGGFEREHSFIRVLRYIPGCEYRTHRQPTLSINGRDITSKDISGNVLYDYTGITMWHGSYVSPKGVQDKIRYYEGAVIKPGQCIPDYFNRLWLPWVMYPNVREELEKQYNGVHEFAPAMRGPTFTIPYPGSHPAIIRHYMPAFMEQFNKELKEEIQKTLSV